MKPTGDSNQSRGSDISLLTEPNLLKTMLREKRGVERVYIEAKSKQKMTSLVRLCQECQVPVNLKPSLFFQRKNIQTGVAAQISRVRACSEEELISLIDEQSIVVVLDGVTNIGNVASILRSSYFLGATAVVMRKRRSAQLNEKVVELSRGAALSVPIARVGSLYSVVKTLKTKGFCILSFSAEGESLLTFQPTFPCALILGDEHKGVSRTLVSLADKLLAIPMRAQGSLNVAVSCGIALHWLWQSH